MASRNWSSVFWAGTSKQGLCIPGLMVRPVPPLAGTAQGKHAAEGEKGPGAGGVPEETPHREAMGEAGRFYASLGPRLVQKKLFFAVAIV